MTDERNPQDRARELAEKIFKLLEREDDDQVFSEDLFIDQAIPLIVAHTASRLAGAVPQEELRALAKKLETRAKDARFSADAAGENDYALALCECAREIKSLIEKRK